MRPTLIRLTSVAAVLLFATPLLTSAQPARVPSVGSLSTGEDLAALGYVDGKAITIQLRYSEGRVDRLPALAAELVRMNVDVIVAWGVEPLEAVRKATNRIPIVMVAGSDPVRSRERRNGETESDEPKNDEGS